MKKLLYVDCTLRGELSRTRRLAEALLAQVDRSLFEIETVDLTKTMLIPLDGERVALRDQLLASERFDHEMFRYSKQFAAADAIVIAAPFWDMSIPAQLKTYIEHVSVSGMTFGYADEGLIGLCKATHLVFVTTRGAFYQDSPLECGSSYMQAIATFFGVDRYTCVDADGLDIEGLDIEAILAKAQQKAEEVGRRLK